MPRYFFNLTNGDSVADEVGEEFDRVEAARGHAIEVPGNCRAADYHMPSLDITSQSSMSEAS
jgi:hypothetical protein